MSSTETAPTAKYTPQCEYENGFDWMHKYLQLLEKPRCAAPLKAQQSYRSNTNVDRARSRSFRDFGPNTLAISPLDLFRRRRRQLQRNWQYNSATRNSQVSFGQFHSTISPSLPLTDLGAGFTPSTKLQTGTEKPLNTKFLKPSGDATMESTGPWL